MSQTFSMKDQKCEQVVVFQDRAEVKRSISTKLAKGETELIINNVSSFIEHDSVRVEGSGEASVVDVVCQSKQMERVDLNNNEKAKKLADEIKELEREKARLNDKKGRMAKQQETLNQFALTLATPENGKEGSHVSSSKENVENFYEFLDSYTDRLEKLDDKIAVVVEEIKGNDEKLKVARENYRRLNVYDHYENEATEIKILIESKSEDVEVKLFLSYIVYNASWSPKYDIRVFGKEKKMIVNYFGMINQTTGEDWTETKISLSTAVPSIGGNVPELSAENVRIKPKFVPMAKHYSARKSKNMSFGAAAEMDYMERGGEMQEEAMLCSMAPPNIAHLETNVKISEIGSTSTFEIPRVATIPSDNETHKVSIAIINLEPEIEYESVPRKNSLAYIKAKVTNKSQYSLLAGPANVFLDNNFVAKTDLKSHSPQEEFECSLGVDPGVRITYKPVNKYKSQTGMLKNFTLTTCVQVIEVKNTTQSIAQLVLKDSVPLSNDDKISVKIIEPDVKKSAEVTLTKLNILEFKLSLKPAEIQEIQIKYSIEHPAGVDIDFF